MCSAKVSDWSKPPGKLTSDLRRFVRSQHTRDLLTVAVVALLLAMLVVAISTGLLTLITGIVALSLSAEIAAALVTAALAAIAWAYQASNLRFGAADIFASEILTLCRISAVIAFVSHLVESFESDDKPIQPAQSTQDYVVIFNNNSKDLEVLDGNVVPYVTEFYVYFKAMIDALSRVPPHFNKKTPSSPDRERYEQALLSVIYTAFLMFESGRQALMQLIDDQPHRREAALTALVSEISAYNLLYREFEMRSRDKSKPTDIRWQRINCRLGDYITLMKSVACETKTTEKKDLRIRDLASQVISRWEAGKPDCPTCEKLAEGKLPATRVRRAIGWIVRRSGTAPRLGAEVEPAKKPSVAPTAP